MWTLWTVWTSLVVFSVAGNVVGMVVGVVVGVVVGSILGVGVVGIYHEHVAGSWSPVKMGLSPS